LLYGLAVMVAVGLCYLLRLENASRLCAVAVTVITLVPRSQPAYLVAFHRFIEVSHGVACAVGYTAAGPREETVEVGTPREFRPTRCDSHANRLRVSHPSFATMSRRRRRFEESTTWTSSSVTGERPTRDMITNPHAP
jgi:hypothetical protein